MKTTKQNKLTYLKQIKTKTSKSKSAAKKFPSKSKI